MPRRDAQRNRERLLESARKAFATGDEITLEAIAKHAGVGIGTLYRHFPTREALVEAVYRNEIDRLHQAADELLHAYPADIALRHWMDRFANWLRSKRGMVETLRALISDGTIEFNEVREGLSATIQRFFDAGAGADADADATRLRQDVAARDVLASITGVFLASGNDQQAQASRMLDLLMDGLRCGASTPSNMRPNVTQDD